MDELTQQLAGSFHVSNIPNNTAAMHPRYTLYKVKSNTPDQVERRRRLLVEQKQRRFDAISHARKLALGTWDEDQEGEAEERMDVDPLFRPGRYYKNQLMLSEWLMEVPEDLPDQWLMVPCPMGRRALIVTSRGQTCHYTKAGFCMNKFPSLLPGGSRKGRYGHESTILDCLYSEADRTYYIMDIMCWNGHPVYDSETEFRFYWLHAKCSEVPGISEISKINPYKFSPLPSFPCTKHVMTSVMAMPLRYELDGVLFYHKKTHYTFGSTPLVVWLKPFMLPDVLDIPVPKEMMDKRPYDYTNYVNHLSVVKREDRVKEYSKETRRKSPRKKKEKKKGESEMDVVEGGRGDTSQQPEGDGGVEGKGENMVQLAEGKACMEGECVDTTQPPDVESSMNEQGTVTSQPAEGEGGMDGVEVNGSGDATGNEKLETDAKKKKRKKGKKT